MDMKEILTTCRTCGDEHKLTVPAGAYKAWWYGDVLIQDAMPELSAGQRELLISGTCGRCFDATFSEQEES